MKKHPKPYDPAEFNPYRPKQTPPKPKIITPELFDELFTD